MSREFGEIVLLQFPLGKGQLNTSTVFPVMCWCVLLAGTALPYFSECSRRSLIMRSLALSPVFMRVPLTQLGSAPDHCQHDRLADFAIRFLKRIVYGKHKICRCFGWSIEHG